METKIIFTYKNNQGNLRGLAEKAFIEKNKFRLKEKKEASMSVYIGEPDVQINDVHVNISNKSVF